MSRPRKGLKMNACHRIPGMPARFQEPYTLGTSKTRRAGGGFLLRAHMLRYGPAFAGSA